MLGLGADNRSATMARRRHGWGLAGVYRDLQHGRGIQLIELRLGSSPPDRTPCPSRISALEQSIRKYTEEPTKSVVRPALDLSFDSLGEAYDFYNLYSWEVSFGIRYGKKQIECREDKVNARNGCSGKPEAEKSRSRRCKCPALNRLLCASNNSRYIIEHRESHNHSMSLKMGEKVHWPSHKHIDVYTKP